jgi:hypothetical protein
VRGRVAKAAAQSHTPNPDRLKSEHSEASGQSGEPIPLLQTDRPMQGWSKQEKIPPVQQQAAVEASKSLRHRSGPSQLTVRAAGSGHPSPLFAMHFPPQPPSTRAAQQACSPKTQDVSGDGQKKRSRGLASAMVGASSAADRNLEHAKIAQSAERLTTPSNALRAWRVNTR